MAHTSATTQAKERLYVRLASSLRIFIWQTDRYTVTVVLSEAFSGLDAYYYLRAANKGLRTSYSEGAREQFNKSTIRVQNSEGQQCQ